MLSMAFKFKHANRIVGLFVLSALVFLVGGLILVAIQQKVFVKKYIFAARFLDAEGLSGSTPINFKGYEIGRIRSFRLNDQNLIDADFYVVEEYRNKIVDNSALNKVKNPITGASRIELLQGPDLSQVLPEGSLIPSINIPEGQRLLDEGLVTKTGDPVSSMVGNLDQFLYNLNRDNNIKGGAIFRAMVNLANAAEKLDVTLNEVSITVNKLNRAYQPGDGQLFLALNRLSSLAAEAEKTAAQVHETLRRTDTVLTQYQNPDGLVSRMIDPGETRLIQPASVMLTKLNATLDEVHSLLEFVNARQPELAEVVSQGRSTLQTARKTLEGINNNPLIKGGIPNSQTGNPEGTSTRPKHQQP